MSVEISLIIVATTVVIGAIRGYQCYKTALNPLTIYFIIHIGFFTLLSGYVSYKLLSITPYSAEAMTKTALLTLVNIFGYVSAYIFRRPLLIGAYGKLLKLLGLNTIRIPFKFVPFKFIGLVSGMLASFVSLAVFGGGGWRWITDTRDAYIQNRAGAGPFFASMQWLLILALMYYLCSRYPHKKHHLILLTILFALIAYFSGSKGNIMCVGVICIAYFDYFVRPIPLRGYFIILLIFLTCISALLIVQDSGLNLFQYFRDYFDTTAWFISRYDEFEFQYGYATLSGFWSYVPRYLYPDKPFEYGVLLIHKVLFPGRAEFGHTPGILDWTIAYLDFGVIGVFSYGFFNGVWQRVAYEYFLNNRQSFFAFLFAMQFALWAPLPFATPLITILLAIALKYYFRFVLSSKQFISNSNLS
jgi:oligosaccharide repeat unit polymerase